MQVSDNYQLLKLMLEDMRTAPDIYKPTNCWAVLNKEFLPELSRAGLHDFRRRKKSILSCFGATDLKPFLGQIDLCQSRILYNRHTRKIPFWTAFLESLNFILNKIFPIYFSYNLEVINLLHYELARLYGRESAAMPIEQFEASVVGNPEHIMKINGKIYTISMLDYYIQYAYCSRYVNFEDIHIFVELGAGSGKQIEVLKKLHPNICFLVFDIPPQLYVLEQYLSAIFPDDVVSYQKTRDMNRFSHAKNGKIYIFGNWKFPILEDLKVDLFWNAQSFPGMEPDVVASYLTYVNRAAHAIFIFGNMGGKKLALKMGERGVLEQTKLEDYKRGLCDFDLIDMSPVVLPVCGQSHASYSFWRRRAQTA